MLNRINSQDQYELFPKFSFSVRPSAPKEIADTFNEVHDTMRNWDGLHPQEAFDEMLKLMFVLQQEILSQPQGFADQHSDAERIRSDFATLWNHHNAWISELWPNPVFKLADSTLSRVWEQLKRANIFDASIDARSQALRVFLRPELRKGLGIFLTPEPIVRMMVATVNPAVGQRVLDPACGSGTFLTETYSHISAKASAEQPLDRMSLSGIDVNPRMLLLSKMNFGPSTSVGLELALQDSVFDALPSNYGANSYDAILTNPPFGVTYDIDNKDLARFRTCRDKRGHVARRQSSEVVFVERCFQLLRPGGTMGIVLPKSFVTNGSLSQARKELSAFGHVVALVFLPPEAFAITGTQTSTVLLFGRKYDETTRGNQRIVVADVRNVGYDATGRYREGSELPDLPVKLEQAMISGNSDTGISVIDDVNPRQSFDKIRDAFREVKTKLAYHTDSVVTVADICQHIGTGRTPGRSQYGEEGCFIVKVGNLTGHGVSWTARDRNFVSQRFAKKLKEELIVAANDILLTSSAHSSAYIAKKVDIVTAIPDHVTSPVTYVGEVMLLRPDPEQVDPFALLAFLRLPQTVSLLQSLAIGQTAHLHPDDVGNLPLPDFVRRPDGQFADLVACLREEAIVSEHQQRVVATRDSLLSQPFTD